MEPQITVINSSAVDIHWFEPTAPNGPISRYRIYRSGGGSYNVLLYSGPAHVYNTVDASVDPGVQYHYLLETANSAGHSSCSRLFYL